MSLQTTMTEKELEFMEHYYDPTSLTENLFPKNFNAPQAWSRKEKCLILRLYQLVMQNFSYMYANDPLLSDKENFSFKKGAGDLYSIGARNLGKSFILIIDNVLTVLHAVQESCVASFDSDHLKKVTEPIASFIENHKFLKIFHLKQSKKDSVNRAPFKVVTENGAVMYGINEQVEGANPGVAFHGKHFFYRSYEEFSYSSDEGNKKSIDAENSIGHIERPSGIPDLCIGSPLGKIINNRELKPWIWKAPQYIREDWDEKIEKEKADEYGGKSSAGYCLNVLAETVEGAYGFWDMARLKEMSVKSKGIVKSFEISKDTFDNFEERLIIERMSGAQTVFISSDIGLGAAPTEINIVFFDGKKYKYIYNITIFRLIQDEQADIFEYLYKKLGGAFIAIDATGDGGVIIDELIKRGIDPKHLLKVKFNENIEVGFAKDDEDDLMFDKDGNPIMILANTMEWSMKELEKIFYSGDFETPPDPKLLTEFTNIIAKQSKLKTIYGSKSADHLHQSFQVFSISKFFNEFNNINETKSSRSFGVTSTED